MIRNIILISNNELNRFFKSPLAWVILGTVQFLLAIFFYTLLAQYYQQPSETKGLTGIVISGVYQIAGIIMLLVSPLITMNLIAEERKKGTIKLLFSSPLSITEIILGKYLSMLVFYCLMLFMISLMPLSLSFGSQLDFGQIIAGFIGLLLLMSSFISIGLFISCLTNQPIIAAISTFGALFLLWIVNIASFSSSAYMGNIFSYLSLLNHYKNLLDGAFNSVDVFYYLLVSTYFIMLSIWRLDAERTHGIR